MRRMGFDFRFIAQSFSKRRELSPWSNTLTECRKHYEELAPEPNIQFIVLDQVRLKK